MGSNKPKSERILFVFRDPLRGGKSVEEIYHGLMVGLEASMDVCHFLFDDTKSIIYNCRAIGKYNASIIHITSDLYHIVPLLPKAKKVITIHDLGRYKEFRGAKKWLYRLFWIKIPVAFSAAVITVSEASRLNIIEAIGHQQARKIHTIYNPVPDIFKFTPKPFNEGKPVILAVGTGKHKNIETLIHATRGISCKLHLVGHLSETQMTLLKSVETEWINYPKLSYEAVRDLYVESDIVYFVSLHEGFGMPIIEAQAIGRPILVSRRSSIPEVAANGALFIEDPISVSEVQNGIQRLTYDSFYRDQLISLGRNNIRRFDFKKILGEYQVLYHKILSTG